MLISNSSNLEITSDKAVIVFFLLWRQRLGDFSGSFEKKTVTAFFNYHKVTQNFGAALIWAGGVSFICGVDKLDFSSEKDLRAHPSCYILSEYNKCHHPLTVYSFRSLPRFLLTNISRLPTLVRENRGVGTRENRGERGAGGGREKGERQNK